MGKNVRKYYYQWTKMSENFLVLKFIFIQLNC